MFIKHFNIYQAFVKSLKPKKGADLEAKIKITSLNSNQDQSLWASNDMTQQSYMSFTNISVW